MNQIGADMHKHMKHPALVTLGFVALALGIQLGLGWLS